MKMSLAYYMLVSFLFLSPIHLLSAEEFEESSECLFTCGKLGVLSFPFSNTTHSKCTVFVLNCTDDEPKVQFRKQGKWYPVNDINHSVKRIQIHDQDVQSHLESNHCDLLSNFTDQVLQKNYTEQLFPSFYFNFTEFHPFFKCKRVPYSPLEFFQQFQNYTRCKDSYDLFYFDNERSLPPLPANLPDICSVVNLPSARSQNSNKSLEQDNLTSLWSATFTIYWEDRPVCVECSRNRGRCLEQENAILSVA